MSNVTAVTGATFEAEVLKADKPVVVDFWAEWCGPCKMLAPELEAAATEIGESLKVVKVDVDQNQELATKFGIMSIPSLLVFKEGEVADRIVGFVRRKQLVEKLKQVLAG